MDVVIGARRVFGMRVMDASLSTRLQLIMLCDGSRTSTHVPFSGIIRIRDMMYTRRSAVPARSGRRQLRRARVGQGRARRAASTTTARTTCRRPAFRRCSSCSRRRCGRRTAFPIGGADEVMVTTRRHPRRLRACQGLLEPGDEVLVPDPGVAAGAGQHRVRARRAGAVSAARVARLAAGRRRDARLDHAEDARHLRQLAEQPDGRRADARGSRGDRRARARAQPLGDLRRGVRGRRLRRASTSASRRCRACTSARFRSTRSARRTR